MSESALLDDLFIAFQQAVAGRYFIDREIGRGGMGVVYLAREVQLDRMVAIKLLPPALASRAELRARFGDEARLAARLSHPNIVPIHAVDEAEGFVFFVMALVDGETLAERVRSRGPVSAMEGTRLLRDVALALAYAHGQGVVHRDVKPDNILIDRATGRALVADFGIAAAAGDETVRAGAGTPAFMSPEQLLGEPTDVRSDIYSFGVTAYYALSGRLPFEGATLAELAHRVVHDAPAPLASLGLAIPRRLAQVVDRCLARDAAQRSSTALAVAEQLGVTMEQRREVPAVLRGFVKRSGRTSDGRTAITLFALTAFGVPLSHYFGPTAAFSVMVGGTILSQVAFLVASARDLLERGFAHADLGPAFAASLEAAREEYAMEADASYGRIGRAALAVSRVGATALGLALGPCVYAWATGHGWSTVMLVAPVLALVALLSATGYGVYRLLSRVRDDVDTRFWAALWDGRVGRALFAFARRFRRGAPVVSAMTHRATELSLGVAAEQLFDALPRATRKQLGDLPVLLRQLQRSAQALRARHDALNDALQQGETGGTGAADPARETVRAERDAVLARLRDAVGALETIRLNLLRLHAGQTTVESITTHLGVANALSADVQRLIAAREDVASALAYPYAVEPTPV